MGKKHNNSKSGWVFGRHQLADLLRGYRKLHRESRRAVQSKLLSLLNPYKTNPEWDQFRSIVDSKFKGSLTKLESPATDAITITLPDIQPLADAYGIPPLIFSSLLSNRENERHFYVAHCLTKDFSEIYKKASYYCGKKTRYSIPPTILNETGSTHIVYHKINPKGYSVSHRHPGQELIYVQKGKVEVQLHDTGLNSILNDDDFIHFDANQLHSVRNHSDKQPAEMFIIRFMQLSKGLRKSTERFRKRVDIETEIPVKSSLDSQKIDEPHEILDRYSLGRFLELTCSEPLFGEVVGDRVTLDALVQRAKKLDKNMKHSYNRTKFARIHYGKADINKDELLELAHIYEVDPMLLYNFLFPAFQYAIALHPKEKNNMRLVPSEFISCKGVTCKVPCRRLANSDTAIATVTIESKAVTPSNHHPGWELLKPIEGEVVVEFDVAQQKPIKEGWYAHFYSHINHRIRNIGNHPAKVFIIRFFGNIDH